MSEQKKNPNDDLCVIILIKITKANKRMYGVYHIFGIPLSSFLNIIEF